MRRHVAVIFGTRPEAIKLFPVIYALRLCSNLRISVWVTGQHRQMLDQVLAVAQIKPDLDFDVMVDNQSLDKLTTRLLIEVGQALDRDRPDCIVVQGDTTSTMAATLAGFYRKIPVAHVEAGLRTGNKYSPWPEEINRRIVSTIADLHFAPTESTSNILIREGINPKNVFVTGNTGIDALLVTNSRLKHLTAMTSRMKNLLAPHRGRNVILVTAHRRESFDGGLARIAEALCILAKRDDVVIIFPIHPNPVVTATMRPQLEQCTRIIMLDPLDYIPFVYLMSASKIILTDSGGIQEEAPSLGKPVLVLRDTTERPEGIVAGTAKLVGTDCAKIVTEAERLLNDAREYETMSRAINPYGDGNASQRIARTIDAYV
jgi:UDP-N-acetylglucosamine 2-epimerase (non-hydrolysing)